jgi:hypothetical protein
VVEVESLTVVIQRLRVAARKHYADLAAEELVGQ